MKTDIQSVYNDAYTSLLLLEQLLIKENRYPDMCFARKAIETLEEINK